MNEQTDAEFYELHDREVARLIAASAPPACIVWVGGQGTPGSRVCGHAEAEHALENIVLVTGIALVAQCRACKRDGLPARPELAEGSGYDHPYIDHVGPRPPAAAERAAS